MRPFPVGPISASAVFAILTFAAIPHLPAESGECETGTHNEQMLCLKRAFAVADGRLNSLYRDLRGKLDRETAEDLKESSLDWIRYKEWLCDQASAIEHSGDENAQKRAEQECLLAFTRTRGEGLF